MKPLCTFLTATTVSLLAAGASGGEAGAGPPPPGYPPLPPELQGDLPAGALPQGPEDLARTREALYGRELSPAQHDEILSWRTHDLGWWMDDARRAGARAKLEALDRLFDSLNDEGEFADAVGESPDLFGLEVALEWDFSGAGDKGQPPPPVLRQAKVTYDARKRPDLFDFYELIHGFASSVASSAAGEGRFLEVIDPAAETMEGVGAYRATVAYIAALKRELGELGNARLRAALDLYIDGGQTYTAADADAFQDGLRSEMDALTELRTREYFDALRDDFRKRLSGHVLQLARAGLSITRGYYSRSFKEDRAREFEALLAKQRGGGQ